MKSRRQLLTIAMALWLLATGLAAAEPTFVSVGTTVADLDHSVAFYTTVLGFRQVSRDEIQGEAYEQLTGIFGMRARRAQLRLGDEAFTLTEYLTPRGRPVPGDSRSNDHWFQHVAIVVSDIDAAYAELRRHGVRHVSTGPQTLPDWNLNAAGIRAFYFQDPDGHNLEIIWYPPGKGEPRWQQKDGPLFLGIDHTAIVVADTERSLDFYRDLLGLRVAGTSENWGTEQEHLNLVYGARLRITALRGAAGPAVEFLEYLSPSNGRSSPADLAANDLVHWEVILAVEELDRILANSGRSGGRPVSSGIIELSVDEQNSRRTILIRDPDGHAVGLVDR